MDALLALGAGVVMACYFLSVLFGVALPGELLFMELAVLGLPFALAGTRPSPLGRLPYAFGCLAGCFCAAGAACYLWSRAEAMADVRLAVLVYALAGLAALTAVGLSMQAAGTLPTSRR